jgi:hypothetical protein
MKCHVCGIELKGGRGAYKFRCETVAIGEDAVFLEEVEGDRKLCREKILQELATMTPQQIERDVIQQWDALLCRRCREELGEALDLFFNRNRL